MAENDPSFLLFELITIQSQTFRLAWSPKLTQMIHIKFFLLSFVVIAWSNGVSPDVTDLDRLSVSLGPCLFDVSDPCTSDKISFYFYKRGSTDYPARLTILDEALPPGFDAAAETKVLIHGFAGSVDFNGIVVVRQAYQRLGHFNVIVVDWGELVKLPCYPAAVVNTVQAGKCTALLLENLSALNASDMNRFHAIGFSLGAHVASFASNEIERTLGKKLGRISGLDPALPFFASLSKSWKLDEGDADFVDVIHTNAGVFGKIEATGHVDFYVNEGFSQPGCNQAQNVPLCSHIMALVYYAESITVKDKNGFWGVPCSSYVQHIAGLCPEHSPGSHILMGERCNKTARGVYFVVTRDRPPYALGRPADML